MGYKMNDLQRFKAIVHFEKSDYVPIFGFPGAPGVSLGVMSKVPPLLKKGGYFPNADHGIQPLVTFENLCKFMTLLHEVTGNPEGEFPRIRL